MQTEGRLRVNYVDWISLALVIIGAINWGLVGIGGFLDANWNVVALLLGTGAIADVVYLLVGLAGLYELYFAYQLYSARGTPGRQTT
jgi:uncharacterized membrane protein YuzA (DUF378 family)